MSPILKTFIFLAALSTLLISIGYAVGGQQGAIYFFGFSLVMNLVTYWFSEKIALSMAHAKPLPENAPGHQLQAVRSDVEEICRAMNMPAPKIYYTEDEQANAFATGRNPKHSSICFTKGILNILDRNELRGVISHELSHIKNRDVLIATIAAVLASAISAIASAGRWMNFSSRDSESRNPIALLVTVIFAPLAAGLIQMAISRQREFQADHTGSEFTRSPMDLANALAKIEASVARSPMKVNSAIASLYISNPLGFSRMAQLFSTHPPTAERIEKLREMAKQRP